MIDETFQKIHNVTDLDLERWYAGKERALRNMLRVHGLPLDPVELRKAGYEVVYVKQQHELDEQIKLCKVIDSAQVSLIIKRA